ncbi:MAG: bifunctional adenosylcobinamide kinase/adenosylcobinamide-phosphate guanylyltransferase [Chloroflexi bacterium]|nr:bifunctional adenosylcobinamide kinase/adenosylcobinamide-phosphate guanylyltransferase [Chloroflexota bacterium]
MENRCILVLGGARSGKSSYAQELAENISNNVLFVATAEAFDEDMRNRIENHRKERPDSWKTLETPMDVASGIEENIGDSEVIILDCMTLLVSNLMLGKGRGFTETDEFDADSVSGRVMTEMDGLVRFMANSGATFIIVSNEVGLGLVPDNREGRTYRDILGRANQLVARHAHEVHFMVAGIPMKVKG